jgi:putative MATE family efflux protein
MIATKDMTSGRPWKLILGFSLPLMLGNVFQLLYTVVDTMVVGKALGDAAVAALGVVHWPVFMMFGFLQGLLQGFSVIMAKRFGAGDYKGLRQSIVNSIYLATFIAIIFTGVGQAIIHPVLILMQTPSEAIGLSSSYLRILYAGVPIAMAYNLLAAMLRALGNSKTPLHAMTIASLCNIALDIIFVFGFRWGIAGVAYATLISEVLATAFCYAKLRGIVSLSLKLGSEY